MKLRLFFFKCFCIAGLFTLTLSFANAGTVSINQRIFTPSADLPVVLNTPTATTTVDLNPKLSSSFKDASVKDKITFGVDYTNQNYLPTAAQINVILDVRQWDQNGNLISPSPTVVDISVKYEPLLSARPYVDLTTFLFNGAYKFEATIRDITVHDPIAQTTTHSTILPSNLYIDLNIDVERYYNFASVVAQSFSPGSTALNIDNDPNNTFDEIEIYWNSSISTSNGQICPEEFELEWTFINDYGITPNSYITNLVNLPYNFHNNSTRITTTSNHYRITMTFDHGYLLYRVRGIGRDMNSPTKRVVGDWNAADIGNVNNISSKYNIVQPHEANKNWQYASTFAEEGKKKEVINYFDGSLRNRQSVTKVNSDSSVIVGETIYDYQGRPGVTVLPVPVTDTVCISSSFEHAIQYYPRFNRNEQNISFSKADFNADLSTQDSCSPKFSPMSTRTGASRYYSKENPNKKYFQGFVPDAEKYPYSQVEYTPDNTGRIRRQGSVGPEFQLGSGHETKYFYGQPNQIQLDRLFGSEVGDASHYKKNLVFDANTQASVSYLDQEGRTIATALAGDTLRDSQNNIILSPLENERNKGKNLTVDLFSRDHYKQSKSNKLNDQGDAMEFTTQLLVSFTSDYAFDYSFHVPQFKDSCMNLKNVCFDCVYDLEIKVTNDCGQTVIPIANTGNQPVNKIIGNFSMQNDTLVFSTECTNLIEYNERDTFKLHLYPGNYTITKTLRVNKQARDFYVKAYLDSTKNGCFKTLYQFTSEALALVDTSDCDITCEQCVASLGTRDQFVASGNGTGFEWDVLYEECNAPCKPLNLCESTYEQLLMDVSPDGQYGKFQDTAFNVVPQNYPVSVFNIWNALPKNINTGNANWKRPKININGTNYPFYLSEKGERSVINLVSKAGTWSPAVANNNLVYYNSTDQVYYTYPENLLLLKDFIKNWDENWAKSLVQFHPEYCYYEACAPYGIKQGTYKLTSDDFDALMMNADEFAEAKASGLIKTTYATITNHNLRIADFFTANTNLTGPPFDPFAVGNTVLSNKMNNYWKYNSNGVTTTFTMLETASIIARCGSTNNTLPTLACKTGFGGAGISGVVQDSLRDAEWVLFKNFYLSEKRKLQQRAADNYARNSCSGYNGCIGNCDYNPYASGMINNSNPLGSPYYNTSQPCGAFLSGYYVNKVKRFVNTETFSFPGVDETKYLFAKETCQCPLATELQQLLARMATSKSLYSYLNLNLKTYPEFTKKIYDAIGGSIPSGGPDPNLGTYVNYQWYSTINGNDLTGTFYRPAQSSLPAATVATIILTKPASLTSWLIVDSIIDLKFDHYLSGFYYFTAIAAVRNAPDSIHEYRYYPLTGRVSLNIDDCLDSLLISKGNDFGKDLGVLWSALGNAGQLTSNNVNLRDPNYRELLTPSILNTMEAQSDSLVWNYTGGHFELYENYYYPNRFEIGFTSFSPSTYTTTNLYPSVRSFTAVQGNDTSFTTIGLDSASNPVVLITGYIATGIPNYQPFFPINATPVPAGKMTSPAPLGCRGIEYNNVSELNDLLNNVLTKKPFDAGTINLTKSPYLSKCLKSFLPDSLQATSTTLIPTSTSDTLIFTFIGPRANCEMYVNWNHGIYITPPTRPAISDIISIIDLTPTGKPDDNGIYYDFKALAHFSNTGLGFNFVDTIFGHSCLPLKKCSNYSDSLHCIPIDTLGLPEFTKYDNPCVQYQMDAARANARNAYNKYIDSLSTVFAAAYNRHCMSPIENFKEKYFDFEYHFTLYYYDQAGNLIRTVPPEGVSVLPITSPDDPLDTAINYDRTVGTHFVTTDHFMTTTYLYNSLNQLVKQNVPDHDPMPIWEYTLPNGLDSRIKVTATQFVSPTRGYLSGFIDIPPTLKRGYLYTTDDGGATWEKINDIVAVDLKKVQMVDALIGFAVGDKGIILKTIDGGSNWDMLPQYNLGVTSSFNDLYFTTNLKGIVVGDDGNILSTIDGGVTFTKLTNSLFTGIRFTSVTYANSKLFVSGNTTSNQVSILRGTITGVFTISWTKLDQIRSTDLYKIHMINPGTAFGTGTGTGFAAGVDGTLLKTTDSGKSWTTIATGTTSAFRDLYFQNPANGVAILEKSPTQREIWKTIDGGVTWTQLSKSGEFYNSFTFYQQDQGYAMGNGGLMKRVVFGASNTIGLVNIPNLDPSLDFTTCYFASGGAAGCVAGFNSGTSTRKIYTTLNCTSNPVWTLVNTTGAAVKAKKIYMNSSNNGILLGEDGKTFKIVASGATVTISQISSGAENFVDINYLPATNLIYGIDKNSASPVKKMSPGINGVTPLISTVGSLLSANLQSFCSYSSGGYQSFIVAGLNGDLFLINYAISSAWQEKSNNTNPLLVNDIQAIQPNTSSILYAVGNEGTMLQSTDGTTWKTIPTGTVANFNAIKFKNTSDGLIAGNNGNLWKHQISGSTLTLNSIPLSTANSMYDIAISTVTNNPAYIVGEKGTVISIPDLNNINPAFCLPQPAAQNFNGVAFKNNSSEIVAVGNIAAVYAYNNTSGARIKSVHPPKINDVHFSSTNNGYLVGETGTIRHTRDGGISWSLISPTNAAGVTPPLNRVYSTAPDNAVIIGNGNYIAQITNSNSPVIRSAYNAGTSNLKGITFGSSPFLGYIAGDNSTVKTINATSGAIGTISSSGMGSGINLNALHVFADNSIIAVGAAGSIFTKLSTASTWVSQSSSSWTTYTFNDVFFHDDKNGYVVGNSGVLLRYSSEATKMFLQPDYNNAATSWTTPLLTGVNGTTAPNAVNLTAIDFTTRYTGFLGGYFNDNRSAANYCRLVRDESNLFSTYFWYDRLGRMVVSQNTKQYNYSPKRYSYTRYDDLGRIIEVGEKAESTVSSDPKFQSIFGEYLNGKYNPRLLNDVSYRNWLLAGVRTEVTRTYYDENVIGGLQIVQDNLRKRVSSVTYEDVFDGNDQTYHHATHYSYDIHGNVKTLLQDNPTIQISNQRFKRIDYTYDLISGKVNSVKYQAGQPDQYAHKFEYDADNRITNVYTSKDNVIWDHDASYFYYAHGPLARVELGNNKVQGMDYAYTLQGWIKGVNSNTLTPENDMGKDGLMFNIDGLFAKDAFGYTLGYRSGDYSPIDKSQWNSIPDRFEASTTGSSLLGARHDLFNGNISLMVTTITQPNTATPVPLIQGTAYRYDRLNRLIEMQAYQNLDPGNQWGIAPGPYAGLYNNVFAYDANGNILRQLRKDQNGNTIDSLTYKYDQLANGNKKRNRLYHVNDQVAPGVFPDDIDDQGNFVTDANTINSANNYRYDAIGNLVHDEQEEIETIAWTVYGKVKNIIRKTGSTKLNLRFDYDASGNRIAKHLYEVNGTWKGSTYYSRDAQGNILATYKNENIPATSSQSFRVTERNVFGSSRIAVDQSEVELTGIQPPPDGYYRRFLGLKQFEGSNHLGNVLTTFSDRKIMVPATQGTLKTSFEYPCLNKNTDETHLHTGHYASLLSTPSGSPQFPPSAFSSSQIIRVERGDQLTASVWSYYESPIVGCASGGLLVLQLQDENQQRIVISGQDQYFSANANENSNQPNTWNQLQVTYTVPANAPNGPLFVQVYCWNPCSSLSWFDDMQLSNQPASLLASYVAGVSSATDYYGFGAEMQGRNFNNSYYRFGFNGKEKMSEYSDDNLEAYDYGNRTYNPLLCRFLSMDKLSSKFPDLTPFQYASNRPIDGIDVDGLEHESYTVVLSQTGKILQTVDNSRYLNDVGQKGWGTQFTFVDEKGNKVFQIFHPSDPPFIWTGANRPLYIKGIKILGTYDELDGESGFKKGGYQTMIAAGGLFFGISELSMATKGTEYLWGVLTVATSVDDIISTGEKSLSENIAGSELASGIINLTKSALSFRGAVTSVLGQIKKGADVSKTVSSLIDSYGGIDNFKKAFENFKKEVETIKNENEKVKPKDAKTKSAKKPK